MKTAYRPSQGQGHIVSTFSVDNGVVVRSMVSPYSYGRDTCFRGGVM